MFELFALIGLFVVGILMLKIFFGVLGLAFKLILVPFKLLGALVVCVLLLPFFVMFLPVLLVLGIGFGVMAAFVGTVFCWAWV